MEMCASSAIGRPFTLQSPPHRVSEEKITSHSRRNPQKEKALDATKFVDSSFGSPPNQVSLEKSNSHSPREVVKGNDDPRSKQNTPSNDVQPLDVEGEREEICPESGPRVPPLFMEHCFIQKRLASFDNALYKSKSRYSREELAAAGFFYTGKGDLVRCFYCGLGLKGWTFTDNVYVEHQRFRPQCKFLNLSTEPDNQVDFELLSNDQQASLEVDGSSDRLRLHLLQRENVHLKRRNLCQMCFRNPARELLFPCREIVVCQPCSEITSTCPSCRTPIKATASIFVV